MTGRRLTDYEEFLLGPNSVEDVVNRARDAEAALRRAQVCEHGQRSCSICDIRDLHVPAKPQNPSNSPHEASE